MKKNNIIYNIILVLVIGTITFTGCNKEDSVSSANPPAADIISPGIVKECSILNSANGDIVLTWTDPADEDFAYVEITINWGADGEIYKVDPGLGAFTAQGLTDGTQYTFIIKTVDESGNYSAGLMKFITPDASSPEEISNFTAAPGPNGKIHFTWTDPVDADFKHIEITWLPNGTSARIIDQKKEEFTVLSLTDLVQYTFTIKTIDTLGNASAGISYTYIIDASPPAEVNALSAVPGPNGKIVMTWTDPDDLDFNHVKITRQTEEKNLDKGTGTYTTGNLEEGLHAFVIKTVDVLGNTSTGTEISETADASPPGEVADLSVIPAANGVIALTWRDPTDEDLDHVQINWEAGSNRMGATVSKGIEKFLISGLTDGEYIFTIKTIDGLGHSSKGASKSAVADAVSPGEVINLNVLTGAGGDIILSWTDPADFDFHKVLIVWDSGKAEVDPGKGTYCRGAY